jgi:aspartyl-tRNA(Asn)/glutamyl-tRNA(Gln) amidotransferase subunit C
MTDDCGDCGGKSTMVAELVYALGLTSPKLRATSQHLQFPIPNSLPPPNSIIFVPMTVNDPLIEKLARLSRLSFNAEEKEEIKNDLQKMISFVEKLNELDLSNVEPLMHVSEAVNVFREDVIQGSISREEAFQNAPMHDGSYFKVPKVIKK